MTSAPITADAATSKVLGVKKTFTVAGTKVTGLSKAEKKVVKVTIKNKKVTVKGLKAGKVTFKIGKKAYTVKVGATKVTATAAATTLKVNDKTTVAIKATNGAKDKLTIKTSQSSVVKIGKSSVTADKNGKASVTLRGLAAGTSTITVKSANTGKYAKVKITVKAADVATATPSSDAPATGTPATATPATDTHGTKNLPIDINTKAVTAGTAKVNKDTGLLDFSTITDAVQNKPITMSATINGVTSTFTTTFVGVNNPAAGRIDVNGYTAESTITLTFSEAVKVSNVTLPNLTISNSHTFGTDATIVATSPTNGYADTFVITLGGEPSVTIDDTITISAANVEDAFGNVASANVTFTCPAATPVTPGP